MTTWKKLWHDDVRLPPACPDCNGKGQPQGDGSGWDGANNHTPACERCDGEGTEWLWVRTNIEARNILILGFTEHISLDHDMGGHHLDPSDPASLYYKGTAEDDGTRLVDWMIQVNRVPKYVEVHSWNVPRALQMVKTLQATGHKRVLYRPYEAS